MELRKILLPAALVGTLLLAGCSSGGANGATGEESAYPERQITLVVPLAAGGSTDSVARVLAQYLGEELGTTITVENRPGAGGVVATTALVREKPDGYTLQYSADTLFASEPVLRDDLGYEVDDFEFIRAIGGNSPTLAVREDSPYADLQELVDEATENGTTIRYGHVGLGSSLQLSAQRFFDLAGVDAQQIPFDGGGAALNALLAGDVDAYVSPETTITPYLDGGGVRALGVSSPERSPFLPDVPSMSELGYDVELDSLSGLYAPAGVPDDVLAVLNDALDSLAENQEFLDALADLGISVKMGPGEVVVDHITSTRKIYEELLG